MALIVDTGPLLATLDAGDPHHHRCAQLLAEPREDIVVPTLVLVELDYWCHRRLSNDAWATFLDYLLEGAGRDEPPTQADLNRCRELQVQYEDLGLGLVDASVIALAERLDEPKIATLDRRHFSTVQPAHVEALELLPA